MSNVVVTMLATGSTAQLTAHVTLVEELYLAMDNSSISRIVLNAVTFSLNQTLEVNRVLEIVATAPGAVLDGMNRTRVLRIQDRFSSLELTNVVVTRGFVDREGRDSSDWGGAGIDNWGLLLATNCTFSHNVGQSGDPLRGQGGGLRNWREATLVGCNIVHNSAFNGGGIDNRGNQLALHACTLAHNGVEQSGGGLFNQGNTIITDSLIFHNQGRGGGIFNSGDLRLSGCTVAHNRAMAWGRQGGGIFSSGSLRTARLTVEDTTFHDNYAGLRGGAVHCENDATCHLTRCLLEDNVALGAPFGGSGLFNTGTAVLEDVLIRVNASAPRGNGRAIFNGASLTYVLPAPLGYHVGGVFKCGRQECPAPRDSSPPIECPEQSCDATLFGNRSVARIPQGPLDDHVPTPCSAGLFGNSTTVEEQSSALCSGFCPAGFICPEPATTTPVQVRLGFWSAKGAAEESECPLGFYASSADQAEQSSALCSGPCPTNHFCNETALTTPHPCPRGSFNSAPGASSEAECVFCPMGTYLDGGACVVCPADKTTSGPGSRQADCVCMADLLVTSSGGCEPCPDRTTCPQLNTSLAEVAVWAGHWRPGHQTTSVRPCPHRDVCANGTTDVAEYDRLSDATCAPGRGVAGAYCLLCMQPRTHFFDAGQQACRPCAQTIGGAAALLAALLAALAIGALVPRCPTARLGMPARLAEASRRLSVHCARLSFRAKLRTVISWLQIVTQLERAYALRYPPQFSALLSGLAFVNVDLHVWVPSLRLHCLVGARSLASQLLLVTWLPAGLALAAPLVASLRGRPLSSALPFVLHFTFLFAPSISSFGFRALAPCDCFELVEGRRECFLRADYEVRCTGSLFGREAAPSSVLVAAWLAVGVWALGVPLLYALLLGASRATPAAATGARCVDSARLRAALGMLVGDYRPAASAWELVVLGEKLTLTGFLALVNPSSWTQIFTGTVVSLSALALQAHVAPYRTPSDNLFAFISSVSLMAIFLGSLGVQTDSLGLAVDATFLVALLFAFTLLVLGTALLFFVAEVRSAREILLLRPTGQPPSLALAKGKLWHLFLSHNWANQDAVATIKRQLQLLLPGVQIFLDVDDLESVDALEAYVEASQAMLVLLGSTQYFGSVNCQREAAAARALALPLVLVHDSDAARNGAPLDNLLRSARSHRLSRANSAFLFGAHDGVIPWHRLSSFQLVALAAIAERMLLASPAYADDQAVPLYVPGALAWAQLTFVQPVAVYAHNSQAADAARELSAFASEVSVTSSPDAATHRLLFVSPTCFEGEPGERLAAELAAGLQAGVQPVLLWSPKDCEDFRTIIEATPPALVAAGLYAPLAVEMREGMHRAVSLRLAAKALGARMGRRPWSSWMCNGLTELLDFRFGTAARTQKSLLRNFDTERVLELQLTDASPPPPGPDGANCRSI